MFKFRTILWVLTCAISRKMPLKSFPATYLFYLFMLMLKSDYVITA